MQSMLSQPMILLLVLGSVAGQGPAASPIAAPMAAPGDGEEEEIPTIRIQFDVLNLDYAAVAEHDDARDGIRKAVKETINMIAEEVAAGPSGAPGPASAPAPGAPALIELYNSTGLRHSKKHGMYATGPAPGPSPIAAPMGSPAMPDMVDTFCALEEGPDDCTEINVWTVDPLDRTDRYGSPGPAPSPIGLIQRGKPGMATPGLGTALKKEMKQVCDNPNILANALLSVKEIHWKHAPQVGNCKVTVEPIQSFHLDCSPHVKQIIDRFTVAYTRAQVPHALEEACHLFESKISFSGNRRITKWDKKICKTATEKLMNMWQPETKVIGAKFRNQRVFKKIAPPGSAPPEVVGGKGKDNVNYDEWCMSICEWKFGKGAAPCKVH